MTIDDLFLLPAQIQYAFDAAKRAEGLPPREKIQHVVVIGVGSAAVAGEMVAAAAGAFMPVPVTVVASYEIPAFVGEGSLVFAMSPTGNHEEVLEATTEAAVQGARIVAITTGGKLASLAAGWSAPVIRIGKDFPNNQSTAGAMAAAAISVLEEVGLFVGASQWMKEAVTQLQARIEELKEEGNFAAALAEDLAGRTVLVHSSGAIGSAASKRWKGQINVFAKAPAFWALQPDLSHNEVAGWNKGESSLGSDVVVLNLRHDEEHPQIARRYEIVGEYLEPHVGAIFDVEAAGDGAFAQVLDLLLIGDYVALQLAAGSNLDGNPAPVLAKIQTDLAAS